MDIMQTLSSLKMPKLFREIITLVGGLGFLLILWVLRLQYLHFNFGITLNRPELDITIIIIGYLVGKMVLMFTHILNSIDYFFDYMCRPAIRSPIKWQDRIKEYFAYRSLIGNQPINAKEVERTITVGEIWKALSQHQLYEEAIERDFQASMFARFFFAYAVLGWWYLNSGLAKTIAAILAFFFAVYWYNLNKRTFISWIEFQKHIVKEGSKRAKEKTGIL